MRAALALAFSLPLVLTGCSLTGSDAPTADAGLAIQGSVRGAQQPIVGAHVFLFAANTTGYGSASLSLMDSVPGSTILDSTGGPTNGDYYVTTGAGGGFAISGDYSCTPSTQIYLYALGGNPGLGTGVNPSSGLMAVLGNCPIAGNFQTATPFVVINEVSTIAAAYALSGFATDATHVSSSGTALAKIGIQNAFANAANLAIIGTGGALATTPAGNGSAPQATVYTLANILASCVNSTGNVTGPTNPTACYTLFNSATSNGTPAGTIPSETVTAAINIAHYPGSNLTALYGLSTATPPFGGALGAQPNDFTLGIEFSGGGLSGLQHIAIDGGGSVWVTNNGNTSVTKLASAGTAISPAAGYTAGGLNGLFGGLAIDLSGNAWITNYSGHSVTVLSGVDGTPVSGTNGYSGIGGLTTAYGIAIDGSGNAWITNLGSASVTELSSAGSAISPSTGYKDTSGSLSNPYAIAVDSSGNAWIANKGNSTVTELAGTGTVGAVLSHSGGDSGGGLNIPYSIAIDGSNNAWVANYGSSGSSVTDIAGSTGNAISSSGGYTGGGMDFSDAIAIDGLGHVWTANFGNSSVTELSSGGAPISPSTGYSGGNVSSPVAIAIDGSGNVWAANSSTLTELIGAATPVVTPLAIGVKNGTLAARP